MASETVLIVDDSAGTREVLRRNLTDKGYRTFTASNVADAIETLNAAEIDLVLTDIRMPGAGGMDLLRHVRENFKELEVVIITGFPNYNDAVKAIKTGAEEYLIKPFTDDELFGAIEKALQKRKLRDRLEADEGIVEPYGLVGQSPEMRKLYRQIAKAAGTSATVLIQGESGTGKELVARAIHYQSRRAAAPFVPVNCGSVPEPLLESELFGYVRGAFTGAATTRAGFFQTADKGTILLDEISEASPAMQVKLLRVLQNKEISMLGSSRPIKVDIRIIAVSNRDLHALVRKGEFREDLYYRLNVITIPIPPLRSRGDDIVLLIRHFAGKAARELDIETPRFSDAALRVLTGFHWPGNVRELENVVHRLVYMAEGEVVDVPDLPQLMRFSALGVPDLNRTLEEVEVEYIQRVLEGVGGNKSEAARILGISRKTIRDKLKNADPEFDPPAS
ncbi:MAG: sigma-54-dependent transcriptional regulator [Desulfobacterales bacterium]